MMNYNHDGYSRHIFKRKTHQLNKDTHSITGWEVENIQNQQQQPQPQQQQYKNSSLIKQPSLKKNNTNKSKYNTIHLFKLATSLPNKQAFARKSTPKKVINRPITARNIQFQEPKINRSLTNKYIPEFQIRQFNKIYSYTKFISQIALAERQNRRKRSCSKK